MKAAISIPDDVFDAAEELAEELGLSRSALYAQAVAEFVAKHRAGDVTARLDAVYAEENRRLAAAVRSAQAKSIRAPDW
jgi:predicted transcriptional regulator